MAEYYVETNAGAVAQKWASGPSRIGKSILAALRKVGLQLQRSIIQSAAGELLNKRTGNLTRAVFYEVHGDDTAQEAVVRAGVNLTKAPYGRIHDQGGVIRPRRAKFLTVPVGANVTPKGVMRVDAKQFIASPQTLGFTGSFVNRKKTAIMGIRPDGRVEPVFALLKSVNIKRTGFVTDSVKRNEAFIEATLSADLKEAIGDFSAD